MLCFGCVNFFAYFHHHSKSNDLSHSMKFYVGRNWLKEELFYILGKMEIISGITNNHEVMDLSSDLPTHAFFNESQLCSF